MFHNKKENTIWMTYTDIMTGVLILFLLLTIILLMSLKEILNENNLYKKADKIISEKLVSDIGEISEINISKKDIGIKVSKLTYANNGDTVIDTVELQNLSKIFNAIFKTLHTFPKYITEIRIEGHTSTKFTNPKKNYSTPYLSNMKLSQDRARNILKYIFMKNKAKQSLIKRKFIAVGMSSSFLISNKDGSENEKLSRRVEIRLITDKNNIESLKKDLKKNGITEI